MKASHLLVATTLSALIAACGQQTSNNGEATGSTSDAATAEAAAAPPGTDPELAAALRCWGYTRASFYLHQASPEMATDIPSATQLQFEGWWDRALRLAYAQDMTVSEFDALRDEITFPTTALFNREFRLEAVAPMQACIDTSPEIQLDQPSLRDE